MLAFQNVNAEAGSIPVKKKPVGSSQVESERVDHDQRVAEKKNEETSAPEPSVETEKSTESILTRSEVQPDNWHNIIEALELGGLPKQLAISCAMEKFENNQFHLSMTPGSMRTDRMEEQLQQALRNKIDKKLQLIISENELDGKETPKAKQSREEEQLMDEARQVIKSDPDIQAICEAFDATVLEDSIQSTKGEK